MHDHHFDGSEQTRGNCTLVAVKPPNYYSRSQHRKLWIVAELAVYHGCILYYFMDHGMHLLGKNRLVMTDLHGQRLLYSKGNLPYRVQRTMSISPGTFRYVGSLFFVMLLFPQQRLPF